MKIGFSPVIVGCIAYTFPNETDYHQSRFAFFINMIKTAGLLPPDPTNVPLVELNISYWVEGGTFSSD
jgi:hypothetical protein